MSGYGVFAMECVVPLKLQYTWLSGYAPLVRLRTRTSKTCCAAGMVLVSPHHESGGAPVPPPVALVVGLGVGPPAGPIPIGPAGSRRRDARGQRGPAHPGRLAGDRGRR